MTQNEYEQAMYDTQLEFNKVNVERLKVELKIMQLDAEIKAEQLAQMKTQVKGS